MRNGYKVSGVVAGLLLCGLGFSVWNKGDDSTRELAHVKSQVRAAGLPLEPRDLVRPTPPDGQNAAPLYTRLTRYLDANPLTGADKILDGVIKVAPRSPQEVQQIRLALKHRQDILQRVHQAAQRPACVFNRDYSQGANLMLPEYAKMRSGMRMLTAESTLLLEDGQPFDAIHNQALGFQMAQHAAHEPVIIGNLVGVALDAITLRGMEIILYRAGGQAGVAQEVEHVIAQKWKPHSLASAMGGDLVMCTVEMERTRKAGPNSIADMLKSGAGIKPKLRWLGMQRASNWQKFVNQNEAEVLRHDLKTAQVADRPFQEANPILAGMSARIEKNKDDGNLILSDEFIISVDLVAAKQAQNRAKAAVVRAAACVLAWKQRQGTLPVSLQQVMSPVPVDPFNGQPLHYRREGQGFVIYSVGKTGKFDGGTPNKKPDTSEEVFHYPMPAYYLQTTEPKSSNKG